MLRKKQRYFFEVSSRETGKTIEIFSLSGYGLNAEKVDEISKFYFLWHYSYNAIFKQLKKGADGMRYIRTIPIDKRKKIEIEKYMLL